MDHDLDHTDDLDRASVVTSYTLCRICAGQIRFRKHLLDYAHHPAVTQQHEHLGHAGLTETRDIDSVPAIEICCEGSVRYSTDPIQEARARSQIIQLSLGNMSCRLRRSYPYIDIPGIQPPWKTFTRSWMGRSVKGVRSDSQFAASRSQQVKHSSFSTKLKKWKKIEKKKFYLCIFWGFYKKCY